MAWPNNPRPARSIVTLRDQVSKLYPKRSKASDGTIADDKHAKSSDHHPDVNGIVKAWDVTYDSENGPDLNWLASMLIKDSRINYIIYNRRIWQAGKWKDYTGKDPHTNHMHISVNASNGDDSQEWKLSPERKTETMTAKEVDEMIAATYVAIKGENPPDSAFVFHREQYAKQGDRWWLQMVKGFKGDDIAWKKYERNLADAGKLLSENPDAKKLDEIKKVLERR